MVLYFAISGWRPSSSVFATGLILAILTMKLYHVKSKAAHFAEMTWSACVQSAHWTESCSVAELQIQKVSVGILDKLQLMMFKQFDWYS